MAGGRRQKTARSQLRERALEAARRIYEEITDRNGGICREYLREVNLW